MSQSLFTRAADGAHHRHCQPAPPDRHGIQAIETLPRRSRLDL